MKKFVLLALLATGFMKAQEVQPAAAVDTMATLPGRNEIRTDLVSLIADSRFNLSYERFLNRSWSVGIGAGYADSQKVNDDFDSGYRNTRPVYDITPFVRYKLSKNLRSYYFAEAFLSANGGDFKETVRLINEQGNAYYINVKSNYSDFGVGGGLGYKLYIGDSFGLEFLVAFGTNLFDTDKSPDVLSRVGLSAGFRF